LTVNRINGIFVIRTNVRLRFRAAVLKSARAQHLETADKLQRILQHAAQVFAEKGYEGASIRDISRSSGVSLSGLYYYVESKQKLLYLIQLTTFKTILARLEKRLGGVSSPDERLRIFVHNHLEYFLRHPVEMRVMSHEDEALEGAYRKEVAEIKRRYYGRALGIFEELRKAGIGRRINPRVAVLSLFGMMNWIYTWHRPQVDPQADALAETISGMFLHGVSNGRGPASAKPSRMARREVPAAQAAG
jgi:TetR/AcrR family transcriptional regulator, cholesterol catabolism regulator